MAREGFYNSNRFRSLPFLKLSVGNPLAATGTVEAMDNDTIVDAGFLMGLASGYEAGVHSVWLDSVSRSGELVSFAFASDAPGLYRQLLVFTRDLATATPYETEFVDNTADAYGLSESSDSLFEVYHDSSPGDCPPEPLWSGFIVTGTLVPLAAALASGHGLTRGAGGLLEPALVQSSVGGYVASVNVANLNRTRVTAPAGCSPVAWAYPVEPGRVYVQALCLRGDIAFTAGYNAALRQEDFNNAIVFGAEAGAGTGTVCDSEPTLFPGEVPPAGSLLLEGGPTCNQVVRSINGVGGQYALLLGGPGVTIRQALEANTLTVAVDMSQLATCAAGSPFSEVSEIL